MHFSRPLVPGAELGPLYDVTEFDHVVVGFAAGLVRANLDGLVVEPEILEARLYPFHARKMGRQLLIADRFPVPPSRPYEVRAIVRTPLHPLQGMLASASFMAMIVGSNEAQIADVTVSLRERNGIPHTVKAVSTLRIIPTPELDGHIYVRTHES